MDDKTRRVDDAGRDPPGDGHTGAVELDENGVPRSPSPSVDAMPDLEDWHPYFRTGDLLDGRFRVVRFLGHGGMGEVYSAEDLELDARVAVKVLRPEMARDGAAVARIRREIQLARQVTHPNVCRIFDLFRHDVRDAEGRSFRVTGLSMELLSGETLDRRLARRGRLQPEEALPIVRQLAAALDAAHAAGVVHRDFKSANVMLVPASDAVGGERAVVTDFGLARPSTVTPPDGVPLTERDMVMGTADYMAPEQVRGRRVTPSTDVYALGVVIYEMVTGVRPHAGGSPVEILLKRVRERPRSPRRHVPDLDSRWEATILRCLEPDPERRFSSAGEVVRALEGRSPVRRPPRRFPPLWRGVAILSAIVLLAALTPVLLDRGPAPQEPEAASGPAQITTWPSLEIDPAFAPGGSSIAFSSNHTGRFEIYLLALEGSEQPVQLTDDGRQSFQPAWMPDGSHLVYASQDPPGLWLMPVNGGPARRLTSFGSHPDVAPNGETVVFQSEAAAVLSSGALPALPPSTIWLVDIASGAIRPLTRPGQPAGGHGSPSFSPDGRWIAFTTSDQSRSEVWVVAAEGGEPHPLVQGPSLAFHPRWCPDSEALYYCAITQDGRSGLWRVPLTRRGRWPAPGPPQQVVSLTVAAVRQFDLSDDGERLVHTAFATASNLWSLAIDPSTGAPDGDPRPMTTGSGRNSRPLFSPDGALLAFERSQVGLQRDIWCLDMASGRLQQITTWKGSDTQASWSGSDTIVYLSDRDDEWALWATDLATRTARRLLALPGSVTWVRTSPDGRTIAYHQQDSGGAVNLWRRDVDGSPPRQLTFGSGRMAFPSWSPSGLVLAFESRRGDDDVIYTLPSAGGEPELVVDEPGLSWPNDWSPDGRRILFVALRDGLWNVWWVDRFTGQQLQLTHESLANGYLRYPAWSPRGDLVVYEVAETIGDLWLTRTTSSR